jgi:hypothetical protein
MTRVKTVWVLSRDVATVPETGMGMGLETAIRGYAEKETVLVEAWGMGFQTGSIGRRH